MAQHEMTHPTYGTRVVDEERVVKYERVGWTKAGEVTPEAVDASVKDVLAQVGTDRAKALQALDAEQSRSTPRPSLVTALARIAEHDTKES